METGETPSLDPSCCYGRIILSFTLHLANLYEVPLPKCDHSVVLFEGALLFLHKNNY